MRQKRYQYISSKGIQWTDWFDYDGIEEPIQLKCKGTKLLNEYRDKPTAIC